MQYPRPLEKQIIAALRQALAENQLEVAEHLLRAIEALCSDATLGTALAEAYSTAFGAPLKRSTARILLQ
ncbi:hypothetical protein ACFQY5_33290 [Paeniroseomonas aquatica]|uniref:Uncharacterized protein n=1 Tax=Paeniroseomonas aquatica TaxID=373043 RepID=A0ABT8A1Y4_9PROT|nr:hypothetical protein [Paeniroseomonas aquatica]MDN3563549.1 hypothetical protein [Paeniroseomonas aquatica]